MNPKTFQVKLSSPVGSKAKSLAGHDSYTFETHAANYDEALDWVTRMFDGVDIKTNAVITDCDQMKKYETIKGKRFAIEKPEGYYRASAEEVAISLYKLIETLSKDYVQFLRNVKLYTELSEQFGEEIHFKNLNAAKQGARLIKAWLNNLLKDFPSHCNNELIREDICQALLAAINKIAAQR